MEYVKDYYKEIDKAIEDYESFKPYHVHNIDWICQRIDWCWKFRHISPEQKDELCDRIISVMDNGMGD